MNNTYIKKKVSDLRVLIVEDEAAIALLIEDMLLDFECTIVGIENKISEALEAAETADIDVAVMDVNIAGKMIYPVAEILRNRDIPFIFSTGYGEIGIREDFRGSPVLQKPFLQNDLLVKLQSLFA